MTAQKYTEPLSKVPMRVAAYDGHAMDELGARSLDDIQSLTPELDINYPAGPGNGNLSYVTIRGIGSTSGAATTAIYIDDAPIEVRRGTLGIAGDAMPKIFDLDRIEVLRGPQGTLFGADAEGGAIRYITPQPDFAKFSGMARGDVSYTHNGAPSYETGVAAGGPLLDDHVAFRGSFDYRREGGYIDRVDYQTLTVEPNSNSSHTAVARVALAVKPIDALSITPSVYWQETRYNDANNFSVAYDNTEVSPNFPATDLATGRFVNGQALPQAGADRWLLPSLKVEASMGPVTVTSVTGYFDRHYRTDSDYTNLSGLTGFEILGAGFGLGEYPATGTDPAMQATSQSNLTQELRIAHHDPDSWLQYTAGVYFANLRQYDSSNVNGELLAGFLDYPTQEPFLNGSQLTQSRQHSGFGQIDIKPISWITVSAGMRVSRQQVEFNQTLGGFLLAGPALTSSYFTGKESETATTPRLDVAFQPDDQSNYYVSVAKGDRPGGTQPAPAIPTGVPGCELSASELGVPAAGNSLPYKQDTTTDTEVGAKNKLFSGIVSSALSVYLINWNDVQQFLLIPNCAGVGYIANLGKARVNGVDWQVNARPSKPLLVTVSLGYTDAKFVKNSLARANSYLGAADTLFYAATFRPRTIGLTLEQRF